MDEIDWGTFSSFRELYRAPTSVVLQARWKAASNIVVLKGCSDAQLKKNYNAMHAVKFLQACESEYVVRLLGVTKDIEKGFSYMVLEKARFDLAQELVQKSYSTDDIWTRLQQIASGLEHVHACGVLHRDMKPSNILVFADDHIKLSDFGVACFVDDYDDARRVGSPAYFSPDSSSSQKADVWAMGVILYEMMYGRRPWDRVPDRKGVQHIIHSHGASPLSAALEILLEFDSRLRPSAQSFLTWLDAKRESQPEAVNVEIGESLVEPEERSSMSSDSLEHDDDPSVAEESHPVAVSPAASPTRKPERGAPDTWEDAQGITHVVVRRRQVDEPSPAVPTPAPSTSASGGVVGRAPTRSPTKSAVDDFAIPEPSKPSGKTRITAEQRRFNQLLASRTGD